MKYGKVHIQAYKANRGYLAETGERAHISIKKDEKVKRSTVVRVGAVQKCP
jgi:hypothetical protein